MTDLLTSLRKEIEKWKEYEEEYEREKKEDEEIDRVKKYVEENVGEAINFIKKFQELFQFKVKVYDLL